MISRFTEQHFYRHANWDLTRTVLIPLSLVQVLNINDSPPKFFQEAYETVLLLPTYLGVEVLRLQASDPDLTSDPGVNPDLGASSRLVYSLADSNQEHFSMGRSSGILTLTNRNLLKDRYRFNVKVTVWPV